MRYSILILLMVVFITPARSQEGVVRYLVTHNWVKKIESCEYLTKDRKEKASYMWGNDAEWKEWGLLYFSGQKTKYKESEEKVDDRYDGYSWRQDEYFLYRDLEARRLSDIIKIFDKVYVIEDTLVPQAWKIRNDIKEVAGHICMNATWTDTIKNQKVMAWFALDIPFSAGPDRYSGLPGLILEINVNDGAIVMTADKFDTVSPGDELKFPAKQKGKRITEAVYQEKIRKYIAEKKEAEEPWFWGIRY